MTSLVAFLGLIGCATSPQNHYDTYQAGLPLAGILYKAGVNGAIHGNDQTNCEIEAVQRVPQRIVESTTPTYTSPVSSQCNQIGTQTLCTQIGGNTYGGRTSSIDANAELRMRAYEQCMVNKNYRRSNIPACPQDSDLSSLVWEALTPPLTRTSCYIANEMGVVQVF
jgi:hypothetical protein